MIHIRTFDLLDNFARLDYSFNDDSLIIKIKSLTLESEYETRYEKIKVISWKTLAETKWIWGSFLLIGLIGIINSIFDFPFQNNLIIQNIQKIIVLLGLSMYIPVFRKHQYCTFYDTDRNHLATIKVDNSNRELVENAINLIKKKTEIICEENPKISLTDKPVFELRHFEFPYFLNRSVVRFYEDRLIETEKSLIREKANVVNYSELSGKTQIIKEGNKNWDYAWEQWLFFWSNLNIFLFIFFRQLLIGHSLYLYILAGGFIVLVPLFLLKYVKGEALLFYNKNDAIVFWVRQNTANKDKLEKIVEFIQSKISA
jgi:hypothetical protein